SSPCALDAAAVLVPVAAVAPARQRRLQGLRRGGLPTRVVAGRSGPCGPARIHVRPGAGRGGRGRTATVARSGRADAAPLARAGRGGVLRDVLLRVGHALLPGKGAVGSGRPHADPARAAALLVLARVGAATAEAATRRSGRRARDRAASRPERPGGERRPPVPARGRRRRDSAAA